MTRPTTRRRRTLLGVLVVGALVGLPACGDDAGPEAYSEETRAAMLGGCREQDSDPDLIEVCECAYDGMTEELGFDEFAALEARLADGDARLPATVVGIIRDCIRGVSRTRT